LRPVEIGKRFGGAAIAQRTATAASTIVGLKISTDGESRRGDLTGAVGVSGEASQIARRVWQLPARCGWSRIGVRASPVLRGRRCQQSQQRYGQTGEGQSLPARGGKRASESHVDLLSLRVRQLRSRLANPNRLWQTQIAFGKPKSPLANIAALASTSADGTARLLASSEELNSVDGYTYHSKLPSQVPSSF
jgi:hypothetical protein